MKPDAVINDLIRNIRASDIEKILSTDAETVAWVLIEVDDQPRGQLLGLLTDATARKMEGFVEEKRAVLNAASNEVRGEFEKFIKTCCNAIQRQVTFFVTQYVQKPEENEELVNRRSEIDLMEYFGETRPQVESILRKLNDEDENVDYDLVRRLLMGFSEVARHEGMFVLNEMIIEHSHDCGIYEFLSLGSQLVAEGSEPDEVSSILNNMMRNLLSQSESLLKMVIESFESIQNGESPQTLNRRLAVYSTVFEE